MTRSADSSGQGPGQIETPRPCQFKNPTDAERKRFKSWVEKEGWCSCCRNGLTWGERTRVVHIGREDFNVAICTKCLGKMTKALAQSERADSEGK